MSTAPDSKNFDIGFLLGRAWELFMKNAAAFAGGMAVVLLLLVVLQYGLSRIAAPLASVGAMILTGPLWLGMNKMAIHAVSGRSVQLHALRWLSTIRSGGACQHCPVHLHHSGIRFLCDSRYLGLRPLSEHLPFPGAEGGNFWTAMERGRKFEMDNLTPWLLLGLLVFAFNCAGAALCGLGLVVSVPVTTLMVVLAHDLQRDAGRITVAEPTDNV